MKAFKNIPSKVLQQLNTPIIISLFDYTGSWSNEYRKAGYRVIQIDLKLGIDVFNWNYKAIKKELVVGVLSAPMCTCNTVASAQYWPKYDSTGLTDEYLKFVDFTLDVVNYFEPVFWALENPVGRLNKLKPNLITHGPWYFNPFQFGDPWTKKTGLWGVFNKPEQIIVEPLRYSSQGSWTQLLGGKSDIVKELRSITPPGFSKQFFLANNPSNL